MEGKADARWQGASHVAATSTLMADHHIIQVITDNCFKCQPRNTLTAKASVHKWTHASSTYTLLTDTWVFLRSVPHYSNENT